MQKLCEVHQKMCLVALIAYIFLCQLKFQMKPEHQTL